MLVAEPDDLCLKCPYLDKGECVQSEEIGQWVKSQDKKVISYLNLKNGFLGIILFFLYFLFLKNLV